MKFDIYKDLQQGDIIRRIKTNNGSIYHQVGQEYIFVKYSSGHNELATIEFPNNRAFTRYFEFVRRPKDTKYELPEELFVIE